MDVSSIDSKIYNYKNIISQLAFQKNTLPIGYAPSNVDQQIKEYQKLVNSLILLRQQILNTQTKITQQEQKISRFEAIWKE